MKKLIYTISIGLFLLSCAKEKTGNFHLTGEIIGLKKGMVYLEKIDIDSTRVMDSIYIEKGEEQFKLINNITEAGLFSISVDKSLTKKAVFIGEPGHMTFTTKLDDFISEAKITGSEQQDILKKHDDYLQEIKFKNLDIIKERLEALKNGETEKADELSAKYQNNFRRMYLFSVNYAINHKDYMVAAYIGVMYLDVNQKKLKQKVFESLSEEVKQSKFGVMLDRQIGIVLP